MPAVEPLPDDVESPAVWFSILRQLSQDVNASYAEKWGKWFGKATDFKEWDLLMTDIVTGDAFGVDRIDYLLRDSHHAGVA